MAQADVLQFPTPRARPDTEEMGVTLDLPFGTWQQEILNPNEQFVPDLLPRLEQMQRNDGHVRALYRLLSLPFRRANWGLREVDGGEEERDFVEQVFTRPPYQGGMSTSFDYIRALASKAMVNGFQVWEKCWDIAEVPGHGECIVLSKLAPRAAHTVRFKADKNGGFDGVVQRAYAPVEGYKQVTIPKEKVFFFTIDKEEHPFYGRSLFEPALYHYDKKHKLYYIAHIAAQMGAVPGRLGYEDDADLTGPQKEALRQALASFGFNTAMLVPKGIRVEAFGGERAAGAAGGLLELINHHDIKSSQSVLGQFIDLAQGATATGSYALSQDSSDLFLMCEETILGSFAEHLTWFLIPQLVDLNFSSKKYPEFYFDPLADDMREAMTTIFTALSTATTQNVTPEFWRELEKQVCEKLGLEVDYEAIEEQEQALEEQSKTVAAAMEAVMGDGLGADPMADPNAPPVSGGPPPGLVAAAEDAAIIELEVKRDRIGQFARTGEVGSGAGFASKGQSQHAPVVKDIQRRLEELGISVGDAGQDGLFGPKTAAGVAEFQRQNGLPETGRVDLGTFAMLVESTSDAPDVDPSESAIIKPGTSFRTPAQQAAAKKKAAAKKASAAKKAAKKKATKKAAVPPGRSRNLKESAARLRAAGGAAEVADE